MSQPVLKVVQMVSEPHAQHGPTDQFAFQDWGLNLVNKEQTSEHTRIARVYRYAIMPGAKAKTPSSLSGAWPMGHDVPMGTPVIE